MRMLVGHHAMDCDTTPADWAVLGSRILRAANIATAIHLAENVREQVLVASSSELPWRDVSPRTRERLEGGADR